MRPLAKLRRPLIACGLALVAAVAIAACSDSNSGEESLLGCGHAQTAQPPGNVLHNPGFEEDDGRPWYSKDSWGTQFEISDAQAHSGERSALLRLRSEDPPAGETVRVYGAVQDLCPQSFPDVVSGYYYVEDWQQGTPNQYLQFVVIVLNADNIPDEVVQLDATNHQIRVILAGSETQPTNISNARYVMVSTAPPEQGVWVPFELDLRTAFEELWGEVPQGYESISFFFEGRWDNRGPDADVSSADIYYDDLYIGPAAAN